MTFWQSKQVAGAGIAAFVDAKQVKLEAGDVVQLANLVLELWKQHLQQCKQHNVSKQSTISQVQNNSSTTIPSLQSQR